MWTTDGLPCTVQIIKVPFTRALITASTDLIKDLLEIKVLPIVRAIIVTTVWNETIWFIHH